MTRIVIIGAAGRMGRAVVRAAAERADLAIVAAIIPPGSAALGRDAGELAGIGTLGVATTSDLRGALARAEVAVDFSSAQATRSNLADCVAARKPLVIGTTGFADDLRSAFDSAGRHVPLLVAPNTSVAVTLLIDLVRAAAASLPADFDIEIIDAHHRLKQDAPSGTALALGRAAAAGRRQQFDASAAVIKGDGPRRAGQIGFAAVRGGDIVGDHTVLFAGPGERLSLTHQANDRAIFARGALQAAAWLASQPPGLYSMHDFVSSKSVG